MYFNILLATDLTQSCYKVERKAWELANQFDAKLNIIHVVEDIPADLGVSFISNPQVLKLKKKLDELGKTFLVPTERLHLVTAVKPKNAILAKAKELQADLIVIGKIGKSHLLKNFGSTTRAILRNAKCDVLTVRCGDNHGENER